MCMSLFVRPVQLVTPSPFCTVAETVGGSCPWCCLGGQPPTLGTAEDSLTTVSPLDGHVFPSVISVVKLSEEDQSVDSCSLTPSLSV